MSVMHSQQNPVINNWYTNLTGKLFKVRMASYSHTDVVSTHVNRMAVERLVIEYIDGSRQVISKQEWDCLKLMEHNSKQKQQANRSEELVTS